MREQAIRFTKVGGRRVAWAASGEGPPLVIGGWWMSHLELDWRDTHFRAFVDALGRYRTVIRYDRPGTGLSAGDGPPPRTLADEAEVLSGVVDAVGSDRIEAFAASSGGPVVVAFAAGNQDLVERIVLYGSYATGAEIADEKAREALVGIVRRHWGLGSRVLADVFMPTASAEERTAFAQFQRASASPEIAAASLESVYTLDASDRLDEVRAPVLVLHRRGDRTIDFALGQDLAARIPAARFIALAGADHLPWRGDSHAVVDAVLRGLGVDEPEIDIEPVRQESVDVATATPEIDLSDRELEVLKLVALGLSDREIAEQLVLSPHTVHRHVANIRTKLRLPSRAAAAAHAARLGLL